eukprot:GFUD01005538.1.p1 GENE.GFUD01005538.1~~GFUD01005538.1.p1  ORF type:complete len:863 (-),score=254.03 GFUD01005538.1:183-2771(-)
MPSHDKRISGSMEASVFRIPPYYYIHVLDQTTNVTRLETGPQIFVRKDNEMVLMNPERMITVPPRHYCIIQNPVVRDENQQVVRDNLEQVMLEHAEEEIRLQQDPFPLFPGEELKQKVTLLNVVPALTALRLKVTRDYVDAEHQQKVAGDEMLFEGPGTYVPRKEVEVIGDQKAIVIKPNEALKLKAIRETVDRNGKNRVAGEEWMVKRNGAYLPGVYEEVVERSRAYVLTEKAAVHIRAKQTFTNHAGKKVKSGEEYLITSEQMETFIPDVYEEVVGMIAITTLTNRQYCVILNPVGANGYPQLGAKKLIKGEKSFFLQPGELLEKGIQDIFVLSDNEGILLRAREAFEDTFVQPPVNRQPGDKWMLKGPQEYIPSVEVEVVTRRKAIPLHENEGIYVRSTKTGQVRAVKGQTYMLDEDEELWEKNLPAIVRTLLSSDRDTAADRGDWVNPSKEKKKKDENDVSNWDASKVITFQVPHNAAVQIYDYKSKNSRVVFGPDLVMLGPDEQFTQLSLSAGKPKKGNMIRAVALLLGPDFASDFIIVETSDHARLQLDISYNWHFHIKDTNDEKEAAKLFCVADFVGDLCKSMASKIRGAVSSVTFDDFHKNSAKIIQLAVFGVDPVTKDPQDEIFFPQNNLYVTSVDIKSVEPVDQRTRDSLQKSVTLAIEITTQSQEAAARREAERTEQESRGRLERQRIEDEALAENSRKELLSLQAESAAVESTGQAKAEAYSRAEAARIEAEAAVQGATLRAEALNIETRAELERMNAAREADIKFALEQNKLEIEKAEKMAKIETDKFNQMVTALGTETIMAMASGPQDHQVKMLQSLGLSSTLITDGRTPINLLNTAGGLLGNLNLPQ